MQPDRTLIDFLSTTYDKCFDDCKTAVLLEGKDNIPGADDYWRATVKRIREFRAVFPNSHIFESDPGRDAIKRLQELELTAQEHLDLHEGMRLSLQSFSLKESPSSRILTSGSGSGSTSASLHDDNGIGSSASLDADFALPPQPPDPPPRQSSFLDIARRRASSLEPGGPCLPPDIPNLASSSRKQPSSSPSPSPSRSPVNQDDDRSSSPSVHKFRKTLRPGTSGFKPRDLGRTAPGADRAAAAAWVAQDSRTPERTPSNDAVAFARSFSNSRIQQTATPPHQKQQQQRSETFSSMRYDRHTRRLVPRADTRRGESDRVSAPGTPSTSNTATNNTVDTIEMETVEVDTPRSTHDRASPRIGNTPRSRPLTRKTGDYPSDQVKRHVENFTDSSSNSQGPAQSGRLRMEERRNYSGGSRREIHPKEPLLTFGVNGDAIDQDPGTGVHPTHTDPRASRQHVTAEGTTAEVGWDAKRAWVLKNLPPGVDNHTASQILDEIDPSKDTIHWRDIAGLDEAKNALKEAVVYPFLRPDLFRGLREPPRGILLFGPPGTGKTMLARAVATESESTYIPVTASTLNSKYLGESEKHVRALFTIAKMMAPSIIFVDEVDSILSQRSSSGEHEASRRLKTEFLIQWSSLEKSSAAASSVKQVKGGGAGDNRVLVLAATNRPWDLDDAATRRFARRQYIPLPETETRSMQLRKLLESEHKHCLAEFDINQLVQLTDGYSGSDITHLARQASYGPLRSHGEAVLHMSPDEIRPVEMSDFVACLRTVRPSVNQNSLKQFEDWAKQFGERIG